MKLGYIGLGKMGKNMVLHMLEQEMEVIAWNRSPEPLAEVATAGAIATDTIEDLVNNLESPRIIWLMLPAGGVTDEFIDKLVPLVNSGDLIIDGANSFYKDTLKRNEKLNKLGIRFMDIGVSGGPGGARNGACMMIGGNREDFEMMEETIKKLCSPNAYQYLGKAGAGHFAKMVHNGIEYGMMEAIAEGAAVLEKSQFNYDLAQVFDLYNHKSVIESRLVGWTQQALAEDPKLEKISSVINMNGEGEWTVNTADELGISVPVLEDSVNIRKQSVGEPENFRNKVVSAMRGKFGGHKVFK